MCGVPNDPREDDDVVGFHGDVIVSCELARRRVGGVLRCPRRAVETHERMTMSELGT